MDHPTQRRWAEGALQAVNHVFPQVEFEVWSRCERYLPHAQVCAELIEMWKLESLEAARLLHEAGYYLEERARYGRAEQLLLQSKKLYERVYTSHHSTVAQSLENYVTFLRRRNRKQKAAKLQARVQAIRTRLAHETKEDMA